MVCAYNIYAGVLWDEAGLYLLSSDKLRAERKSPLNLVGLAAAGGDGMNKGSLTVDGEARIANHVLPPLADLH